MFGNAFRDFRALAPTPVILIAFACLPVLLSVAAPVAAEDPPRDPVSEYENSVRGIRGLLAKACSETSLPFDRIGRSMADLSMMRDEFRIERFDAWMADPMLFKITFDSFSAALKASAPKPEEVFGLLCRLNDVSFFPQPNNPDFKVDDAAAYCMESLKEIRSFAGAAPDTAWEEDAALKIRTLPADLAAETGLYLREALRGAKNFKAAFDAAGLSGAGRFLEKGDTEWFDSEAGVFRQELYDFHRRLDLKTVLYACLRIVRAGARLYAFSKARYSDVQAAEKVKPFEIETPLGRIAIAGPGKDEHPSGKHFLILDLGGDDVYGGGAGGARYMQYASLCIDLSGNDRYVSGEDRGPSFGAGFLGAGMLFDAGGDDAYDSRDLAQGACEAGMGILLDESGKDAYTVSGKGQGAASFGCAALIDLAGDDVYTCVQYSQGVGLVKGVGALVDASGDDRYVARDDEIVHPSPQSPKHNSSLAQGCGMGRRADMADGHSASGGVGILVDGAGKDTYSGGVMVQAHGYWYGVGVLSDYGGDDRYSAAWYGQSTSAHFGLSYMRDAAGNDFYSAEIAQNLGNGRDLSVSIFEDDVGDDTYEVADRGAGCGNISAAGIFLDLGGNDTYLVKAAVSMGRALLEAEKSILHRNIPTVGFFIDLGGKDKYEFSPKEQARPEIRDGSSWKAAGKSSEHSFGWDSE